MIDSYRLRLRSACTDLCYNCDLIDVSQRREPDKDQSVADTYEAPSPLYTVVATSMPFTLLFGVTKRMIKHWHDITCST